MNSKLILTVMDIGLAAMFSYKMYLDMNTSYLVVLDAICIICWAMCAGLNLANLIK